MFKIISWHVWAAAAIAAAAILMTIFDPSALILITLIFALCIYIVVRIKKGKFTPDERVTLEETEAAQK